MIDMIEKMICTKCNLEKGDNFAEKRKVCKDCRRKYSRELARKKAALKPKKPIEDPNICRKCNTNQEGNMVKGKRSCRDCYKKYMKEYNTKKAIDKKLAKPTLETNPYICSKCNLDKGDDGFYKRNGKISGKICKDCYNITRRLHVAKKRVDKPVEDRSICRTCKLDKGDEFGKGSRICKECRNNVSIKNRPKSIVCKKCNIETDDFNTCKRTCKECERSSGRMYRRTTTTAKEWTLANKDRMSELQSDWYARNSKKILKKTIKRYKDDPLFRKVSQHRNAVRVIVKGGNKSKYVDCDGDSLRKWMTFQLHMLDPSFTLEDHGTKWCNDHLVPVDTFLKEKHSKHLILTWLNIRPTVFKTNLTKNKYLTYDECYEHLKRVKAYILLNDIDGCDEYVSFLEGVCHELKEEESAETVEILIKKPIIDFVEEAAQKDWMKNVNLFRTDIRKLTKGGKMAKHVDCKGPRLRNWIKHQLSSLNLKMKDGGWRVNYAIPTNIRLDGALTWLNTKPVINDTPPTKTLDKKMCKEHLNTVKSYLELKNIKSKSVKKYVEVLDSIVNS
jgi:hypothetical protein